VVISLGFARMGLGFDFSTWSNQSINSLVTKNILLSLVVDVKVEGLLFINLKS